VVITTYSMLAHGKRSRESKEIMAQLQSREWGLIILDEVHVVPADIFRKVIYASPAHCKLGLTGSQSPFIYCINFYLLTQYRCPSRN